VRPEVVAFFESVRRRYQAELTEEVRRRGPKGSAAVNLLPPWGQFRNGHRTKAWVILGGELTLVTSSVVSAGLLYGWRNSDKTFPPDREDAAQALRVVNYVSLGLLAALVVYGIVDGLYYYYRTPAEPGPPTPQGSAARSTWHPPRRSAWHPARHPPRRSAWHPARSAWHPARSAWHPARSAWHRGLGGMAPGMAPASGFTVFQF
jgi:hypothetical protein